jgi:hypothetical protein
MLMAAFAVKREKRSRLEMQLMKFFRRFKDLGVEGAQAQYYDKLCREHRLEEIKAQARQVAKFIKNGDTLLELAPGPGYLSIELSKLGQYKYEIVSKAAIEQTHCALRASWRHRASSQ